MRCNKVGNVLTGADLPRTDSSYSLECKGRGTLPVRIVYFCDNTSLLSLIET